MSTKQFIADAEEQGLEVEAYAGRWFWKGPAVRVDGIGDFGTSVPTQSDQMGLGWIVYPVAADDEWYEANS